MSDNAEDAHMSMYDDEDAHQGHDNEEDVEIEEDEPRGKAKSGGRWRG
jgi:hypothetical protein